VRTTYIIGSREDIEPVDYDPATLGRRNAEVRALMRPTGCSRDFSSAASAERETSEAEVAWLLDRLRSIGLRQTVAVDLTRPEFAIPVVRMVVPGLEGSDHHHLQYCPGPRARSAREQRS
jgi:ribosomal protein S12 methylthiotransferase accessory factor